MARFRRNDIMSLVEAHPRYDLAESVGPDLKLGALLDLTGREGLDGLPLAYGTAEGDRNLRQAVADRHGVGIDDVVITVGGMQALFLAAFILCREKSDEVVTTSPLFPMARTALDAVGATVRTVALSFAQRYQPDLADLTRQLSPRTRLVSLASPQNPSGVALRPETVRGLLAAMAKTCPEAYLLLDETYREAAYGADPVAPSAVGLGARVISTASLSKCHGAPGLRLGWAVTRDQDLREQLVLGKFATVLSCSAIDEALALRVLQQSERIIGERRRHLAEGLAKTAAAWVEANDGLVEWVRPDAGALCCIRLAPAAFDDAAVARFYEALHGEGVRVANGAWFGDETRVFRLGFGLLSMPDLDAALKGLAAALRK
ncbi:MAG: pyridoxal phosphate-dependent aminotransferase, partial [Alphaproteobacteria bacterium]|nr:pyridoxal phosphate-dependent aminotransferase [Alphaproteobacteria bacterium]